MSIREYTVPEIPSSLYQKLYRLNEGATSLMKHELAVARSEKDDDTIVTVSLDGDSVNGWCINTGKLLQVYVRHSKRRRGIGSRLVQRATKKSKRKPAVIHGKASEFFDRNGFR